MQHGAHPGQDGAGAGAPLLHVGAGGGIGDPQAVAVGQGRAAIERGGGFEPHPRAAMLHAMHEADIEFACGAGDVGIGREQLHLDACRAQPLHAFTRYERVGVLQGHHHFGNARADQGVATGWGAAVVRARLQRDVHRAARGRCAPVGHIVQRHDFGMRLPGPLGVAAANDLAVGRNDDAAHARVGAAPAGGLLRQLQRQGEMFHGYGLSLDRPCFYRGAGCAAHAI